MFNFKFLCAATIVAGLIVNGVASTPFIGEEVRQNSNGGNGDDIGRKIQFDFNQLSGNWTNQLGSVMTLTADKDGGLTGTYNSAVGVAERIYTLTGRFDAVPPANKGVSLGWVVTWRNNFLDANSTTTWSGQYFNKGQGGPERILTLWLLTSSTFPVDVWKSTTIGNDTFTRINSTPRALNEIAKVQALTIGSQHPQDILAAINPARDP